MVPYDRDRRDKPGDDEGEWVELVEMRFSARMTAPQAEGISIPACGRSSDRPARLPARAGKVRVTFTRGRGSGQLPRARMALPRRMPRMSW